MATATQNAIATMETKSEPTPVVMAVAHSLGVEMDQYGRDIAERTIVLESDDAEAVDQEVTNGKWQTYDEALHYVLARGFAEIKRQREASKKFLNARLLQVETKKYQDLLAETPSLVTNQDFVLKMMASLGKFSK